MKSVITYRLSIRQFAIACACLALPIATASQAAAKPTVEVAFVLDTTGSMGGLLEGAKRKIWSIATSVVDTNPDADIRIGLVAYRDIGDEYVTKTFDLTTDIQDIYANLLELKARGGGDWPESVNEALDISVNKLHWASGSDVRRIVFLVGDAPPHMDYAQDTKYPKTLAVAAQRDIIVNAVQAGAARDTERVWQDIAQLGNGRYIPIPLDGGEVVVIETPYDDDIIILQRDINRTVIPYGTPKLQKRAEEKTRQLSQVAAAAPVQASEMASYLNKRSKVSSEAITGDGDLVSAVASGRATLESVKDEDLQEDMRKLSSEQRKLELDKQTQLRKALNERLAALVQKRDSFIAEKKRNAGSATKSSFDSVVENTLKAQIKR